MKRKGMRKSTDKKIFKNTATAVKSINLNTNIVPRGGIRL